MLLDFPATWIPDNSTLLMEKQSKFKINFDIKIYDLRKFTNCTDVAINLSTLSTPALSK